MSEYAATRIFETNLKLNLINILIFRDGWMDGFGCADARMRGCADAAAQLHT